VRLAPPLLSFPLLTSAAGEEELKAKQDAKRLRKAVNAQVRQEAAASASAKHKPLAVNSGAVSKKKTKGFRMKKNGAFTARQPERCWGIGGCSLLLAAPRPVLCCTHAPVAVTVKGVKITDSDSKKEAQARLQALKAEQALALMEE